MASREFISRGMNLLGSKQFAPTSKDTDEVKSKTTSIPNRFEMKSRILKVSPPDLKTEVITTGNIKKTPSVKLHKIVAKNIARVAKRLAVCDSQLNIIC